MLQAREAEERKAEDASNPLKSAIETYALTPADIQAFISYFGAMDVERKGAECFTAHFTSSGTVNGSGTLHSPPPIPPTSRLSWWVRNVSFPCSPRFSSPYAVAWRWAYEK